MSDYVLLCLKSFQMTFAFLAGSQIYKLHCHSIVGCESCATLLLELFWTGFVSRVKKGVKLNCFILSSKKFSLK